MSQPGRTSRAGRLSSTLVLLALGSRVSQAGYNLGMFWRRAVVVTGSVNPVYPTNGANWNDYVSWTAKGGANTVFNQPDTACAGTESGYYGCIHGGEKKKYVATGQTSCADLTAADNLGVFDWICNASSGTATFYSTQLKVGKGLRDLVSASTWNTNFLTVTKGGQALLQSVPAAWWSNPVGPLPVNRLATDAPTGLSTASKVYTLATSDSTSGYEIYGINKVSVVTLGNAILSYSGNATKWCDDPTGNLIIPSSYTAILCGGNAASYGWIEGNFNGNGTGNQGGYFLGVKFFRLRNSNVYNFAAGGDSAWDFDNNSHSVMVDYSAFFNSAGGGLNFFNPDRSTVKNSIATNNSNWGFYTQNGNFNLWYQNISTNNHSYGFLLENAAIDAYLVSNVTANNGDAGLNIKFGKHTINALTSIGNLFQGIFFNNSTSSNSTLSNVVTLNSPVGVSIDYGGSGNKFSDLMSGYHDTNAAGTGSNSNLFSGNLWVGNDGAANSVVGGSSTGNQLNNSCAYGPSGSSASNFNAALSFTGKITANDTVNATAQTAGSATYATGNDWTHFQNAYRGWGKSGTGYDLSASVRGNCASGTCQIFDWLPQLGDITIRNYYGAFVNGAACPSSVDSNIAANVMTDQMNTVHTYLRSAIEVIDPVLNPNGNYNGLCESGEVCIYTPNLGAYQGDGDFTTQTCTYAPGGAVTGVTMYAYPSDGEANVVTPVYPVNGSNWNDYVKWSNKGGANTVFNQPDTACAGNEVNYLAGCIHGGEKRKYVVSGQNTCTGLVAVDSLGTFDWICDASSGTATFYSKKLKSGKGLKDLLTSTAWQANSVIVTKNGANLVQSTASVWWGNPVMALPVNNTTASAPVALTVSGGIYTLSASAYTSGYTVISVDKVGIVTLGTAVLSYTGYTTGNCFGGGQFTIICAQSNKFIWVEGKFSGANLSGSTLSINLAGDTLSFARFHNVESYGVTTGNGLTLQNNINNSLIDSSSFHNINSNGFYGGGLNNTIIMNTVSSSSYNGPAFNFAALNGGNVLYQDRAFNNNTNAGFSFNNSSGGAGNIGNFLVSLTSTGNQTDGLDLAGNSSQTTGVALTLANNLRNGLLLDTLSANQSLANVVALNSQTGVWANSGASSKFTDLVAGYSAGTGIYLVSNNNAFSGNLYLGNNGTNCSVTGTGNQLNNSCYFGPTLATPAATGINASASFFGILNANDSVNGSAQTTGTAAYQPSDWVNFQNSYRTWGKSGASALAPAVKGDCNSGNCQIFDWSLQVGDVLLKNANGAFTNGAACPASVNATVAANVLTDQQSTVHTYLRSAIEVMDPVLNPNGNFNGICESNEACIYTPNLGAYQGQGDFTTQTCPFTGGNGVTNVTMYGYPFNGGATYGALTFERHPFVYYRFNESGGAVAKDYSGNGRDGTYSGLTLGGANLLNNNSGGASVTPAGAVAYMSVRAATYPTDNKISVECWFKPTAADLPGYDIAADLANNGNSGTVSSGFQLRVFGSGAANLTIAGGEVRSASGLFTAGSLYHVAGTYDGNGHMLVYLNGAQVGSQVVGVNSNPWLGQMPSIYFGVLGGPTLGTGMGGQFSECAIYDAVLSSAEIAAHYNAGK